MVPDTSMNASTVDMALIPFEELESVLPKELRDIPRWVGWRYEDHGEQKPTKVPIDPKTGSNASSTDSATWAPFWKAVSGMEKFHLNGIGIVLDGTGLIGVDVDHCLSVNGAPGPVAREIMQLFSDCYTEKSPSKRGLRIFVKGKLPAGRRKNKRFEVYENKRFMTVTGWKLPDAPVAVPQVNGRLSEFHARFIEARNIQTRTKAGEQSGDSCRFEPGKRHDEILKAVARFRRLGASRDEALIFAQRLAELNNPQGSRRITPVEIEKEVDYVYRDASAKTVFVPPDHWKRLDGAYVERWKVDPLRVVARALFTLDNLVFVAGVTQIGKTLLMLYLCLKLLIGGRLFEEYEIEPIQKIVYFILEDPDRRVKDRILDYRLRLPDPGRFIIYITPGLAINDDGMYQFFYETVLKEKPDNGGYAIVIDTYQRATPGVESADDKLQGPILHKLASFTRELKALFFIVDHVRKADNSRRRAHLTIEDLKGTGGKAQNADAVILLESSGKNQIKLQSRSKDFDPVHILLDVSPQGSSEPKYRFAGEVSGEAKKKQAESDKEKTIESLKSGEWFSVGDIERITAFSDSKIGRHLKDERVEDNGQKGRWKKYRLISSTQNRTLDDSE